MSKLLYNVEFDTRTLPPWGKTFFEKEPTVTHLAAVCVALYVAFASPLAHAETTAKVEVRVLTSARPGRPVFGLNALVERPFTPKLKLWAWLQVEEKWAESYAGLAYAPLAWLELGGAVGVEEDSAPWRLSGYVWMGNKYVSFLALAEMGGSGPWYQGTLLGKPLPWFAFGAMIKRFVGVGYRVDFTLPTPKVTLWAAHLPYDPESNTVDLGRVLIGLNYGF